MKSDKFQTFDSPTSPEQGPPRLAALRALMASEGWDVLLVPRADRFQGEYVAPRDDRLAWLTGFTGSAGFALVTADHALVFVDGRYRVQVRAQVAPVFTPMDWPAQTHVGWLAEAFPDGAVLAYDPWLHTMEEIGRLTRDLPFLTFRPVANPIDRIWPDQPPRSGPTTFPCLARSARRTS